jgi:Leucine-rich repeat (LRR) protein
MKTILLFLSVFLSANLFSQNVYIPDANFKALLVAVSQINTNDDTEIQVSEASAYYGILVLNDENISDLTGIEAFTALTFLVCSYNQLTSLDVSQNTALTRLDCRYNQLTSLDISQNTSLQILQCGGNQLTSLDVSQNIALESLWCVSNQLTSLDVSQNTALNELLCYDNQLTCLNVVNGNNINMNYSFQFWAENNPNLTCIEVDNVAFSTANWTNIDPQTSFSEDCNNDCSTSTVGLTELSTSKNLIQILDMMGRETSFKPNTSLIYVYDDGSAEKVFSVEY